MQKHAWRFEQCTPQLVTLFGSKNDVDVLNGQTFACHLQQEHKKEHLQAQWQAQS